MDSNQDEPSHESTDIISETQPKASYKSFRRKYRKIMVNFEDKMRESTTLYREQQRILDISRRLSEQNDQLLELLHDLNESPYVPASHRYDLQPPTPITKRPTHSYQAEALPADFVNAPMVLREARQNLENGRISIADYYRMEDSVRQGRNLKPKKSYAALLETSTSKLDNAKAYNNAAETVLSGFLAPQEELQYLEDFDAYLDGAATTPRPFAVAGIRGGERSSDKDREMALKNPVSVYNWLRKHQPQVFLQDNEAHLEKQGTRQATSRASKRASIVKQEPDLYDEDGIALDMGSGSRAKRKRDDDPGYRPKGGNGRPTKRKKEDGSSSAKKSKRASTSGPI